MLLSCGSCSLELDNDALPKVSVIVPFYNQGDYVAEALESVFSQEYPCLEVIVVDDGSTDGSLHWENSNEREILLLRQANAGPAAARNAGINASSGEVIAFIDSDDRWPMGKLKSQLLPLIVDERIDMVLSKLRKLSRNDGGHSEFRCTGDSFFSLQLGCLLVRRKVFDDVGLFDETLLYSEDQDWFLRARERNTNIMKLGVDGLHYRSHESSLTHRISRQPDFGLIRVLKRSLSRRRSSGSSAQSLLSLSDLSEWEAVG